MDPLPSLAAECPRVATTSLPTAPLSMSALTEGVQEVYVFRHCVRSTAGKVTNAAAEFRRQTDYTNLPLPKWGVPQKWCTPGGVALIEGTGRWLADTMSQMNVSVVADPVERDGHSAMAFLLGLGRLVPVQYESSVFDTLDPETPPPLCTATFDRSAMEKAAKSRLDLLPLPQPLADAEALLQELVGVGAAGPLAHLPRPQVIWTGQKVALNGSVNVLKRFSQNLFYAFASGVEYRTHRPISVDELYELVAWQHWYRSIVSLNAKYATASTPATLELRLMDACHHRHIEPRACRRPDVALLHLVLKALAEPGSRATLFWGHDGNLDGLALLLDLAWDAPPFRGGNAYLPTPPGSGLRFRADSNGVSAADRRLRPHLYPLCPDTSSIHRHRFALIAPPPRPRPVPSPSPSHCCSR